MKPHFHPHKQTLAMAAALAFVLTVAGASSGVSMTALVLPAKKESAPQWKVIKAEDLEMGVTAPANTNIVFYVPASVTRISRSVLFGPKSTKIRYWGYCLTENSTSTPKPGSLPGKVFLSEAERAWRQKNFAQTMTTASSSAQGGVRAPEAIRHQMENFLGSSMCYLMTSLPLPVGTDGDGDGLNVQLEKQIRSDPVNPDTDGDGVKDGDEITIGSSPLLRDTDSDGLIDGIENANRDGRLDENETDASDKDSDSDSLCDGYCRVTGEVKLCRDLKGQDCFDLPYARWVGEDKNLNGTVDKGEYNPRSPDTDKDQILDGEEYLDCLLKSKDDC